MHVAFKNAAEWGRVPRWLRACQPWSPKRSRESVRAPPPATDRPLRLRSNLRLDLKLKKKGTQADDSLKRIRAWGRIWCLVWHASPHIRANRCRSESKRPEGRRFTSMEPRCSRAFAGVRYSGRCGPAPTGRRVIRCHTELDAPVMHLHFRFADTAAMSGSKTCGSRQATVRRAADRQFLVGDSFKRCWNAWPHAWSTVGTLSFNEHALRWPCAAADGATRRLSPCTANP
jgi:hypothetical protein